MTVSEESAAIMSLPDKLRKRSAWMDRVSSRSPPVPESWKAPSHSSWRHRSWDWQIPAAWRFLVHP